jgi:chromosome segregation ATPase
MHRLAVDAEPGKTATVDVVEERQLVETAALASLDPAQLQVYVRLPAASAPMREALNKAILAKSAIAAVEAERAKLEGRLRDLEAEQGRIRTNLQATSSLRIDDVNDENRASRQNLLKRYLDRLSSLETELETERTALAALRKDEADKSESLGKLLESLVAE